MHCDIPFRKLLVAKRLGLCIVYSWAIRYVTPDNSYSRTSKTDP